MSDSTTNLISLITIIGSYMEAFEQFIISFQDSIGYITVITLFFVLSIIVYFIYLTNKSGKLITSW